MSGNNITDIFLNYTLLCMYCNIQLITNIIDLIHKFGMYSRFGYNRQICQGRLLYLHSTNILYTRQNRLFIKSQSLEVSKIIKTSKKFVQFGHL